MPRNQLRRRKYQRDVTSAPSLQRSRDAVWKPKYYMNRPRILVPRQIEVQRKVEVEGGGGKSAKPVAWSKNQT